MGEYNHNRTLREEDLTDYIANAVPLRADIHIAFDNRIFAFVPKLSMWTVDFLRNTRELGQQFHNTTIEVGALVSPQFMLARFAWAIFGGNVPPFYRFAPSDMVMWQSPMLEHPSQHASAPAAKRTMGPSKKRKMSGGGIGPGGIAGSSQAEPEDSEAMVSSPLTPGESAESLTDDHLSTLKRKWIVDHRPSDRRMYCCDYRAAEEAQKTWPREPGEGFLCQACRGWETPSR